MVWKPPASNSLRLSDPYAAVLLHMFFILFQQRFCCAISGCSMRYSPINFVHDVQPWSCQWRACCSVSWPFALLRRCEMPVIHSKPNACLFPREIVFVGIFAVQHTPNSGIFFNMMKEVSLRKKRRRKCLVRRCLFGCHQSCKSVRTLLSNWAAMVICMIRCYLT